MLIYIPTDITRVIIRTPVGIAILTPIYRMPLYACINLHVHENLTDHFANFHELDFANFLTA